MPIVNHTVPVGTFIRYIGPTKDEPAPDTIEGCAYVISGYIGGDAYYFDEVGEKNFSASQFGEGDFEIIDTRR